MCEKLHPIEFLFRVPVATFKIKKSMLWNCLEFKGTGGGVCGVWVWVRVLCQFFFINLGCKPGYGEQGTFYGVERSCHPAEIRLINVGPYTRDFGNLTVFVYREFAKDLNLLSKKNCCSYLFFYLSFGPRTPDFWL